MLRRVGAVQALPHADVGDCAAALARACRLLSDDEARAVKGSRPGDLNTGPARGNLPAPSVALRVDTRRRPPRASTGRRTTVSSSRKPSARRLMAATKERMPASTAPAPGRPLLEVHVRGGRVSAVPACCGCGLRGCYMLEGIAKASLQRSLVTYGCAVRRNDS